VALPIAKAAVLEASSTTKATVMLLLHHHRRQLPQTQMAINAFSFLPYCIPYILESIVFGRAFLKTSL
jgi:hypothetical protein